ncbi:hypothetical protein KW851_19015 [Pseudomonas sp. PDM33]|uniref:hypothetical protein n=1 Tax=unclassified Pseudomonas TaxID=196821 RepID=UPI0012E00E7D|nr:MULTISPECIES: hypothetical protein [unclassified Pseudomonas]MBV7584931.1 hypothetical protein [Pseudomonas sp. PDM33]
MTSDVNRPEGDLEAGLSAFTASQSSDQAVAHFSPGTDDGLYGLKEHRFASSEGLACPVMSAGYIPIQGGSCSPAGPSADPQTVEAFENLERDLAELASACSGLDPDGSRLIEPLELAAGVSSAGLEVCEAEAGARLLDSLRLAEPLQDQEGNKARAAPTSPSSQPTSHSFHEEHPTMNAQAQPATTEAANARVFVESTVAVRHSSALETDGVLHDVQSTLDSLAGMAHGLSQQKLEIVKMREALEERRLATLERERQLAEREERLIQQEQRLQEDKYGIERIAEHNATVLAERSTALQALAETVDSRDRATTKRAEILGQEQQSIDRQQHQLRARGQELDDREAGLQRQSGELADRFKQLLDAKERFGAIVKGFNETVRFNTTYSAISKTVGTGTEEA